MARVLICWELGEGLGHVGRIVPLAKALRSRGHEVWLALKDVSRVGIAHDLTGLHLLQAPQWPHRLHGVPAPQSYSEIMLHSGFWEAATLGGLLSAWRSLHTLVRPQLIITEHAPVALFAARCSNIPAAQLGNGFMCPPPSSPLPAFQPANERLIAQLRSAEARIVRTIANLRARDSSVPEITQVAALFEGAPLLLTTWPELDHYPRSGANYWGPFAEIDAGETPQWPPGNGTRAFVYLKGEYSELAHVFDALKKNNVRVMAYCPGLPPDLLRRYRSINMVFSERPFSTRRAISEAHFVVTHGGDTVVCAALQAGRPQWILPMHDEQLMTARNIERAKVGLYTLPAKVPVLAAEHVRAIASKTHWVHAAQTIAHKYASYDFAQAPNQVAQYCESLIP